MYLVLNVRIQRKDYFLSWQIFSISNKLNMKQMVEISIKVIYPNYYKLPNKFVLLLFFLGQLQKVFLSMLLLKVFSLYFNGQNNQKILYIVASALKSLLIYKMRKLSIQVIKSTF